jgi:hypothetical protein
MRPSRADVLAAVLAEPSGTTTRRLAEKLATVPYQIQPNLSKLAADGQITKTVISSRGDAVWGPISSPAISPEWPTPSCPTLEIPPSRLSAPHGSRLSCAPGRQLSGVKPSLWARRRKQKMARVPETSSGA